MVAETRLEIEYESAVVGLLEALQQHEDKELRQRIVASLKHISQQSVVAVQALTAVLVDTQVDMESQQAAVYALGAIGSREAVRGLLKALQDANCQVKESVVRVLAAIGSGEAIRGLIVALTTQNKLVRETILLNAIPRLNRQIFEAELLTAVLHEDENVQKVAERILERLGFIKEARPI